MKSSRIIVAMSLIAVAAAVALGLTAFRLARHEQNFRRNETRSILASECNLLAVRTATAVAAIRDLLTVAAAGTAPNKTGVLALERREPLLRGVFLAGADGKLLYPAAESGFARRYATLFSELVSATRHEAELFARAVPETGQAVAMGGNLPAPDLPRVGKATYNAPMAKAKVSDAVSASTVAVAAADRAGKIRMSSRFGVVVGTADWGWLPWFAGNEFCPLIWAKCRNDATKIVGGEVEMVAVQSRIVPLFPQKMPRYFRFEMTDSQGRVIFASGYHPANAAEKAALTPTVIVPVSDRLIPGWQVRGYLIPALLPTGNYLFSLMLQIAALLLLFATCGGVALWLARREIVVAGQKTSFVAYVSHELKTPLTSIRMYAEMLHDHPDRLPPEKQRRYLEVILSESERLSRLIANILDFSRIEAGKKQYHPVALDVRDLLRDVAGTWHDRLLGAGIDLELQLPEVAVLTRMDRDSLVQVLHNLLSNAVKYAASGRWVGMVPAHNGTVWQVSVIDHGPGIPPGCRRRLFRKFYRGDDRLTAEQSGSGLGLAIARKLLRDQGGDLSCRPASAGTGTEFIITLPGESS
ncbi:MAG: HAMP domain-containing sensor histidine kinase [Victivallales bacterium]|nr:HAMP domain-containing sensor histidine kinase [Victivallales bacterium]